MCVWGGLSAQFSITVTFISKCNDSLLGWSSVAKDKDGDKASEPLHCSHPDSITLILQRQVQREVFLLQSHGIWYTLMVMSELFKCICELPHTELGKTSKTSSPCFLSHCSVNCRFLKKESTNEELFSGHHDLPTLQIIAH